MRWLVLVWLAACGTSDGNTYDLAAVRAMAGEHTVAGVDTDRAGGIWIVYRDQVGGYYALADVWVTHLDAAGTKLSEWYYNDDYSEIGGITYSGDALWVSYSAVGTANAHLRKLDPTTGATIGTFATDTGLTDITYGDGSLYLSWAWNEIWPMDPTTGALGQTIEVSGFPDGGAMRGIAYADGDFWVALNFTNTLYLVDATGHIIGRGTSDAVPGSANPSLSAGLQLAGDGSALIVVGDNQIVWLAVHER